MGVIAEFSVDGGAFGPPSLVGGEADVRLEFESVVPTSGDVAPYVWVSGDAGGFEHALDASDGAEYAVVDRQDGDVLYRVHWGETFDELCAIFVDTNGALLDARASDRWHFSVRFPDDTSVTRFHERAQEHGYDLDLHRLGRSDDGDGQHGGFGLTPEQREALVRAVEGGYFAIPRQATLDDIADEFDISNQAASERVRRATATVLQAVLEDDLDRLAARRR